MLISIVIEGYAVQSVTISSLLFVLTATKTSESRNGFVSPDLLFSRYSPLINASLRQSRLLSENLKAIDTQYCLPVTVRSSWAYSTYYYTSATCAASEPLDIGRFPCTVVQSRILPLLHKTNGIEVDQMQRMDKGIRVADLAMPVKTEHRRIFIDILLLSRIPEYSTLVDWLG